MSEDKSVEKKVSVVSETKPKRLLVVGVPDRELRAKQATAVLVHILQVRGESNE